MRVVVIVETAGADDGYNEERPLSEHEYEIKELLRSGYYEVEGVRALPSNPVVGVE